MKKFIITLLLILTCIPLCVKAVSSGSDYYIYWQINEENKGYFYTDDLSYNNPFELEGFVKQEFLTPDDVSNANYILANDAKFEAFYLCDLRLDLLFNTSLIVNGNNVIENAGGHYTVKGDGTLTIKTITGSFISKELYNVYYPNPFGTGRYLLLDANGKWLEVKDINEIKENYEELKENNVFERYNLDTHITEKIYLPDEFDEKNFELQNAYRTVSRVAPTEEMIDFLFDTTMSHGFNEDGSVTFYNETEITIPTEPEEEVDLIDTKSDVRLNFLDDSFDSSYSLVTENKMEKLTKEEKENIVGENKTMLALYDISVAKNGAIVEIKNSKLEVKLPFNEDVSKYAHVKVAYIKDGKIAEELEAKLENGYVVFNTTHLSEYAVIGYNDVNPTPANPNTLDMVSTYVIISLIGVSGIIGTALYLKRKA